MARFTFDTGFMAKAQTWTPTNNINPLPAWEFMNQTGTLGTFLAGSAVYVGGAGRVKVIPAGTVGIQNEVAANSIFVGGSGYSNATDVATTGGSGTGFKVSYTVVNGIVTVITAVTARGSGYKVGDIVTISGGDGNAKLTIDVVNSQPPTAADAVEFIGAQAGSILPILVDYVLVPSTGAATGLIVGR